ncbi:hypothetical protein, partial [Acutalibacter muris]|uniref:hypothetical protein n=1 Tax=Acutalibacter muris TaxID=1796620 RepID=UPI002729A3EC
SFLLVLLNVFPGLLEASTMSTMLEPPGSRHRKKCIRSNTFYRLGAGAKPLALLGDGVPIGLAAYP